MKAGLTPIIRLKASEEIKLPKNVIKGFIKDKYLPCDTWRPQSVLGRTKSP